MNTIEQSINVSDMTFVADAEEIASKTADSDEPLDMETSVALMDAFDYGSENGKQYIAIVLSDWIVEQWQSEYPSEKSATNILLVEKIKDWSERAWFVEEARYFDNGKFHPLHHTNKQQAAEYGERDPGVTWLPKSQTFHILMAE